MLSPWDAVLCRGRPVASSVVQRPPRPALLRALLWSPCLPQDMAGATSPIPWVPQDLEGSTQRRCGYFTRCPDEGAIPPPPSPRGTWDALPHVGDQVVALFTAAVGPRHGKAVRSLLPAGRGLFQKRWSLPPSRHLGPVPAAALSPLEPWCHEDSSPGNPSGRWPWPTAVLVCCSSRMRVTGAGGWVLWDGLWRQPAA